MGDVEELKLVSLEQIKAAYEEVQKSFLCTRTPLLEQVQSRFHEGTPVELYLKLENTQVTGKLIQNFLNCSADISLHECDSLN